MGKLSKSTDCEANILKDWGCIGFILIALVLFFPEMFHLNLGFLSGDHRAQHYPWAFYYSQCVKSFQLPWWSNAFHCGFPLLAEGQVGAFYPLNLIFYFLFPTFFAYNFGILFHYFLGGVFFYLYLRSIRLSSWPALFGTLIYLFGTAQGGYYYNIISLKVLIWLPLTFYLIDKIVERGRKSFVFLLGLIFSFQCFAGYLQYALYSIAFSLFYFFWFACSRFRADKNWNELLSNLGLLALAFVLSLALASPQLLATWELAGFSNRFSFTEEFALIGSMNPLSIATLFFPHWDAFLRTELYVGAVGLFFLIISLITKKSQKEFFFFIMAVLGLLLALGQFNPLYVAALKISQFYSFRVPSKFIYFSAFALSIICAFGFEKWFSQGVDRLKVNLAFKIYTIISLLGILGFALANFFMMGFSQNIKDLMKGYIEKFFTNPAIHPFTREVYWERVNQFYDAVLKVISPSDIWNMAFLGLILFSIVWIMLANFLLKKNHEKFAAVSLFILLFVNLYIYGFTSIKGNYESIDFIYPKSKIIDVLSQDKGLFRVHIAASNASAADRLPLAPHTNMLHHLQGTGAYSPLVTKAYFEKMQQAGNLNDSQRFPGTDEKTLSQNIDWLRLLNVKYLISDYPIHQSWASELFQEGSSYLYEVRNFKPRAFIENSVQPVLIEEYGDQNLKLKFDSAGNEKLVLTDLYYPGWKAFVNGEPAQILKFDDVFRSVDIKAKGPVTVEMFYRPVWKSFVVVFILFPFLFFIVTILYVFGKFKHKTKIVNE